VGLGLLGGVQGIGSLVGVEAGLFCGFRVFLGSRVRFCGLRVFLGL
jgi:hypothetical protein